MAKFRYEIIETDIANPYNIPIATYDAYPIDNAEFVITESRQEDKVYYIKKVKNKLKLGKNELTILYAKIDSCIKYWVNIYKECSGGETFIYRCFFNQQNIQYDLDKCFVEIDLQDSSIYNCISDNKSIETNLMEIDFPTTPPLPQNFKYYPLDSKNYRTISLFDAMFWVLGQMACCDESVCYIRAISDFFDWTIDPFDSSNIIAPTSQPLSSNYVNPSQPGYWIFLAAKSDFIDPLASNPATNLPVTFELIEDIMSEIFNVFWIIEAPYYLRWEHVSWFSKNINYDTTIATNFDMNQLKNKIAFEQKDFPNSEKWTWQDSNSQDFVGLPILYDENCSNKTKNRGIQKVSLDIQRIADTPSACDPNGIVVLDVQVISGQNVSYPVNGYLSGTSQYNGRLSTANFQYDLHRYNRPFKTGILNNNPQTFLSSIPKKIQENMIVRLCCEDPYQKSKSLVNTELGAGIIEEAEINFTKEEIKFKLKHD